jgi:tetratricopeptide (TPR) repeat protein
MLLKWLNAHEATQVGTALADDFVMRAAPATSDTRASKSGAAARTRELERFLQRVDRETSALKLNVFKRASLANSFKWRLLEKGVEHQLVDELTQSLVLRLTTRVAGAAQPEASPGASKRRPGREALQALGTAGIEHVNQGEHDQAIECFEEILTSEPRNLSVRNALGVTLCRTGRYQEGEAQFRQAITIKESHPDAHMHLGSLLRSQGRVKDSEQYLRRALKLRPGFIDAQVSLGSSLSVLGRMNEAKELFEKVLRVAPRQPDALLSMGHLAALEGRFEEAETWFNRAIEVDPKSGNAWVGLGGLRRMTAADTAWLKGAQTCADSGLAPLNEASLRTAIGRYHDQVGEYGKAFKSFQRARDLVKSAATPYNRSSQAEFGDSLIRTYGREALGRQRPGASDSALPVFVMGVPRSGTSLIEQIIASHPAASGIGEIDFWAHTTTKQHPGLLKEPPDEPTCRKVAAAYLRLLTANSGHAVRVVDKSLSNVYYLGAMHCVFPNARIIYMRRDPIDTCLSCFFQDFPASLNFTLDLSDMAHFYREYHRLMEHWRSALPPGAMLDVPYEELTVEQEVWTRKVLEFLGLPWDERCLSFHTTARSVLTASHWQVRQKMNRVSVGRWRNYKRFIGPLLELRDLDDS